MPERCLLCSTCDPEWKHQTCKRKNQDGLTKVLDMVPDFVNRFVPGAGNTEDTDGKEE